MVVLSGDLAFLHDVSGLSVASAQRNVTVVVVNNGGGGIFKYLPVAQHAGFETLFRTPQRHADIGALCRGMGVAWQRITEVQALRRALADDVCGVRVLEVMVDLDDSVARHRALWPGGL